MPEQFTTYWPTYEGLRVLQTEDLMQLSDMLARPRSGKDIERLVTITRLRIQIRERREKLIAFEKLARDILTRQLPYADSLAAQVNGDKDVPF